MSPAPLPPSSGRLQTMRRHPVVSFSILAYAVTWGLWIPAELLHLSNISELLLMPRSYVLPGIVLGVTGSAFLMTALTQGKAGVLRLLHRYLLWRVNWRWYAFAILGIPLIQVCLGFVLFGRQDALHVFSPSSLLWYPGAYASRFYFGPLWEEAGWRGFALPRLQRRYGPFEATLLLGLLWGVWHLPLYLPGDIQLFGVVGGLRAGRRGRLGLEAALLSHLSVNH